MDNDDLPIGRVLSRREVLALLGVGSFGLLTDRRALIGPGVVQQRLPACVVRPAQTEGPYFVDRTMERTDIRAEPGKDDVRPGTPLDLEFRVSRVGSGACTPLAAAMVDVWQCDALGAYSDVKDTNGLFDTRGQKWLRGHQLTDRSGVARFTTIYPGWYEGRTVHIHFKVRTPSAGVSRYDFTSQLYFDDALTDRVFANDPYAGKSGRRTRNERDGIFRQGGQALMLDVTPTAGGYRGVFEVGLQIPG
ncbi:MAG: intradiol ring-cleavage dioxygenase [Cytophagaceae bacterium]|nr:intradiol ring-cleavage dioxygenase [Gemmatimonadaceae bacterium]